jgi:hypothetical protein
VRAVRDDRSNLQTTTARTYLESSYPRVHNSHIHYKYSKVEWREGMGHATNIVEIEDDDDPVQVSLSTP